MIRALPAVLLVLLSLGSPAQDGIERPDTAGMDPALAARIEAARAMVEESGDRSAAELAEAWGELGMLYQATGFAQAALSAYDRAGKLDPLDGRWPYLAGIVLGEAGETDAARRHLFEAIALNPALAGPGWTRVGRVFLDSGQAELALRAFGRALAIDDQAPAALAGAGEAHLALEQAEEARDFLERALEIEPRADRLHYPLALAMRALGDERAMREHMSKAGQVGIAPDDPVADYLAAHAAGSRIHILRGRKAWNAGDVAGAAEAFARAAEADPASVVAWTNLGTAQAELGRLEPARASLSKAIELDAEAERARENLVSVLRRLGQARQALEIIESAPGEIQSARWRLIESARILFDLGDAGTAADRLLLALDERGELDIWTEALTALVEAGRLEEAHALATHENLSEQSDPALAAWIQDLASTAEPESEELNLATRLTEHLYQRNPEERFAALHINTLLKRHGRCREGLAWIAAQLDDEETSKPLTTLLRQWSLQLAQSPECGGPVPEIEP